ncbi:hypothetical protein HC928_05465 [bacterium]|nr:hypothetical protein [bacterium]
MPNPRLTVRVPQNLYQQLPTDERERSALLLRLLEAHYNPTKPEDEIAVLKARVDALERKLQSWCQ